MKKSTKVIFWIVAIILIAFFVSFGAISTWTAYTQLVQGLGQEPNIFGYFGYLAATGSNK